MATLYLDLEAGNDANNGTSFAQRKLTFAGVSAVAAAGDTVRIMGSRAPVSLGVNGTWAPGDVKLSLASAVNADIDQGEAAWTASANVTCTTSTTRKEGATSASIAIASGFTTGLAAYKATGTLNLSGYQQISFWIMQTTGTLSANCSIRLCSDTAGVTTVDNLVIPALASAGSLWQPVVINKGSALGSSIQSIALYVDSDQGAQTFLIDNIVACKTSGGTGELTHQTLIGKANSLGAGGDDSEPWYAIRAIRGTTIRFDRDLASNAGSTTQGYYFGAAETVAAYSLKPIFAPTTIAANDTVWGATGTAASRITLSGGWDRSAMTTQNLQTWFALPYAIASIIGLTINASFIDVSRLHFARWVSGSGTLVIRGRDLTIGEMQFSACALPFLFNAQTLTATKIVVTGASGGLTISGTNVTIAAFRMEADVPLTISGLANSVTITADSFFSVPTYNGIGCTVAIGAGTPLVNDVNVQRVGDSTTAANNLSAAYAAFENGTAQAGAASTITLRSGASANNDYYKDQVIFLLSGPGAGQTNRITGYVGATKVATVGTAWVTQPTNASVYIVLGRVG